MTMLTATGLSKSYGAQVLFADASLQFAAGNRYGIVGANGSGKSTLLRILCGQEEASEGTVQVPRKVRVGVLAQDHFQYDEAAILDVVLMGDDELWQAMREKEEVLARAEEYFDADRYAELEDVILRHDGYAREAQAAEILEGLNIPAAVHRQPLSTLSGGYKLRVLLAQTLAARPDILLLDEPTNHLDILSIRWLEIFLADFPGAAVVVSHDHRFLDNVCTHIVDVDYEMATMYPGNYSAFAEAKASTRERLEAEIAKREKEIEEQKKFIQRFRAKATKARQAQSKIKRVEKMVIPTLPQSSRRYPRFAFESCRPSGRIALRAEGIRKAFDDNLVLDGVDLELERGDRLAVIGPNGIGKSTLLKILVGRLAPDAGEVEWGYETHPGYFAQDHRELLEDSADTVKSWLWSFVPAEPIGFVLGNLAQVLFDRDDVEKKVAALSGGEAARLIFSRLRVTQPNVLLLDEPTNHLDLEGIEALASGLEGYDGTILFVSHDRWFVSRLATRILEITPEGIVDFRGTYEEHLARAEADHLDAEAVLAAAKEERRGGGAKKGKKGRPAASTADAGAAPPETKAEGPGAKEAEAEAPRPAASKREKRRRKKKKREAHEARSGSGGGSAPGPDPDPAETAAAAAAPQAPAVLLRKGARDRPKGKGRKKRGGGR